MAVGAVADEGGDEVWAFYGLVGLLAMLLLTFIEVDTGEETYERELHSTTETCGGCGPVWLDTGRTLGGQRNVGLGHLSLKRLPVL